MESAQTQKHSSKPRHARPAGLGENAVLETEVVQKRARHAVPVGAPASAPTHANATKGAHAPAHGRHASSGTHARKDAAVAAHAATHARHVAAAVPVSPDTDQATGSTPRESTVPASRYRAVVAGMVAAVALFAVVFIASPFNPMRMLKQNDAPQLGALSAVTGATYGESAYANEQVSISADERALLSQIILNGAPMDADAMGYVAVANAPYTSQVGTISLDAAGLPSGCEIVSLAVLLQSLEFDVQPTEIADGYLVMDGSFSTGYAGSPYGAGGCYPPGLVNTANSYLRAAGSDLRAYNLTGTTFEGIEALVEHGYPVLVWTTMYGEDPMFSGSHEGEWEWYINEHCVVVYGVTDEGVLVSDPIEGHVVRDPNDFARIYEACGSMAVAIL